MEASFDWKCLLIFVVRFTLLLSDYKKTNFKFKGNFMNGNSITALCLIEKSKNPVEILLNLAKGLDCPVHNPVHHILVGSALLTAYKNAGGDIDLEKAL